MFGIVSQSQCLRGFNTEKCLGGVVVQVSYKRLPYKNECADKL